MNLVELLVWLVLIFILVFPIFILLGTFGLFIEEFEAVSTYMNMNVFRKSSTVTGNVSRFIVFRDKYRFSNLNEIETKDAKFLKIHGWTNGGRYYITREGFPERVGSFIMDGEIGRWRISLTPVVGKVNIHRLK